MRLPDASTLGALAGVITAVGVPLNLLFNFVIAWRQQKLRKSVNGRMDDLISATYDSAHKRGQIETLVGDAGSPPPYVTKAKENAPSS